VTSTGVRRPRRPCAGRGRARQPRRRDRRHDDHEGLRLWGRGPDAGGTRPPEGRRRAGGVGRTTADRRCGARVNRTFAETLMDPRASLESTRTGLDPGAAPRPPTLAVVLAGNAATDRPGPATGIEALREAPSGTISTGRTGSSCVRRSWFAASRGENAEELVAELAEALLREDDDPRHRSRWQDRRAWRDSRRGVFGLREHWWQETSGSPRSATPVRRWASLRAALWAGTSPPCGGSRGPRRERLVRAGHRRHASRSPGRDRGPRAADGRGPQPLPGGSPDLARPRPALGRGHDRPRHGASCCGPPRPRCPRRPPTARTDLRRAGAEPFVVRSTRRSRRAHAGEQS
jgi:hypothetical protein